MSTDAKFFRGLAVAVLAAALGGHAAFAADDDVPSLKGKTIGVTTIGIEHYWNIKAYQGVLDEIKRLGGTRSVSTPAMSIPSRSPKSRL